ncbi:MAG: hypothetical protein GXP48_03905 [Acidobacteria bacterium]|nr:hypothetical protein [Acidobacteriota bacterium]
MHIHRFLEHSVDELDRSFPVIMVTGGGAFRWDPAQLWRLCVKRTHLSRTFM